MKSKAQKTFEKIASVQALQKKRYWQMLKRLYGGTEEAVKELKRTRDYGVYHGTNPSNSQKIDDILQKGLDSSKKSKRDIGSYMGSKDMSTIYSRGKEPQIRLKTPSELTKSDMYPSPVNVVSRPYSRLVKRETFPGVHSEIDNLDKVKHLAGAEVDKLWKSLRNKKIIPKEKIPRRYSNTENDILNFKRNEVSWGLKKSSKDIDTEKIDKMKYVTYGKYSPQPKGYVHVNTPEIAFTQGVPANLLTKNK